MKKGIFLVMLCCVLTGSLCAQNKRLSKIVALKRNDGPVYV